MNIIRRGITGPILLNQIGFVEKLFADFTGGDENLPFNQRHITPLHKAFNPDPQLSPPLTEIEIKKYQSLTGALLWISGMTRPDISFAISKLCQFNRQPHYSHWSAALRVLHFVYQTRNHGIAFINQSEKSLKLRAYSDSDWSGCQLSGRSTTGFITLFSGPISWKSCLQSTTALSTTEAEMMAISDCAREVIYLRQILGEVDTKATEYPSVVFEDNRATREISNKPGSYTRLRHVRVRHFFIQDAVNYKEIIVSTVKSSEQAADILTKIIDGSAFASKARSLGVWNLEEFTRAHALEGGDVRSNAQDQES
jgi:hypothetical protein